MSERERNRSKTWEIIRQAILRIEKGRPKIVGPERKISVAAVAEEAGISPSTIHNRYPDLLECIRGNTNKQIKVHRNEVRDKLKEERAKNKSLRDKIVELTRQRNILAEKNATLLLENQELKAIVESNNVALFPLKK